MRPAVAVVVFTAGCCIGLSACGGSPSTRTSTAPKCSDLVGKAVQQPVRCSDFGVVFDDPGSAGCYPNGQYDAATPLLFIGGSKEYIFGRVGGVWLSGPTTLSLGDMSRKVGCTS